MLFLTLFKHVTSYLSNYLQYLQWIKETTDSGPELGYHCSSVPLHLTLQFYCCGSVEWNAGRHSKVCIGQKLLEYCQILLQLSVALLARCTLLPYSSGVQFCTVCETAGRRKDCSNSTFQNDRPIFHPIMVERVVDKIWNFWTSECWLPPHYFRILYCNTVPYCTVPPLARLVWLRLKAGPIEKFAGLLACTSLLAFQQIQSNHLLRWFRSSCF